MIALIAILALIFIITYDPKSRTLEKFIQPEGESRPCCDNADYRALNHDQCESAYYTSLQFADPNYGCPAKHPKTELGAIIGK